MKIGLISDTHGMLKSGVIKELEPADYILHAGDVGDPDIIQVLEQIAPTHCVRGNMDGGTWSHTLPPYDMFELGGKIFYMVHDLHTMDIDPETAGIEVVVSGHTHKAEIKDKNNILYLNPGSASYGRYGGPTSMAWVEISNGRVHPRIVHLTE